MGGGLSELIDRFKQTDQGEVADSWISKGPNQPVAPHQLEQAIPPDVLATLAEQTGLSREEILSRLSRNLPEAVDTTRNRIRAFVINSGIAQSAARLPTGGAEVSQPRKLPI